MTIVLRQMSRGAADAILAGDGPADVRVADDYPTESLRAWRGRWAPSGSSEHFSAPSVRDDLVVGEIRRRARRPR